MATETQDATESVSVNDAPVIPDAPIPDALCMAAVEVARAALIEEVGEAAVGAHSSSYAEGDRVVTHTFEVARKGYLGWSWSVTVTRAFRQLAVTIDEIVMMPGAESIIAPEWVPYKERLQPGDLGPGDLLPIEDDDPRLVPTYSFGDEASVVDPSQGTDATSLTMSHHDKAQVRDVARELGLGRSRTLSVEGRDLTVQRWYAGDGGPKTALAQAAPAACFSCGFLVRLSGPLSASFGVCANANANHDGRVVALDHGCGAHSEVKLGKRSLPQPLPDHVFDTVTDDMITERSRRRRS